MVELEIPQDVTKSVTVRDRPSATAGTAVSRDLGHKPSPLQITAPEGRDELPRTQATVSGGEWAVAVERPEIFLSCVQEVGCIYAV